MVWWCGDLLASKASHYTVLLTQALQSCTFDASITTMYFWRCHYNHVLLTLSLQSCISDVIITIMYFWRYHYNHVLLTQPLKSCTSDTIIPIMYFWRYHYNHVLLTQPLQSCTSDAIITIIYFWRKQAAVRWARVTGVHSCTARIHQRRYFYGCPNHFRYSARPGRDAHASRPSLTDQSEAKREATWFVE